jgi:hypothetical protein
MLLSLSHTNRQQVVAVHSKLVATQFNIDFMNLGRS